MARGKIELAKMNTLDPTLVEELQRHPMPDLAEPFPKPTSLQLRANRAVHLAKLRHLYPIPGPIPNEVLETDHMVLVRDGTLVRVRVYIPTKPPAEGSALIAMFHEGGWCMGDLTDEEMNCRMFSRDLGAVCVNVEYRLAPEHPFPTSVTDSWDVLKWCALTASRASSILPADPSVGFIVGGASAGGNISAVLCQLARDEGLKPPLTGQYLCVPALLAPDVVPEKWAAEYRSRTESHSDPVLQLAKPGATSGMMAALKPDTSSPLFSPLLHEKLGGVPPAFFQLGGLDPLRDEGLIYERVLREDCGVQTKLNMYEGFGHMFWTNWPELERSRGFVRDTLEGVLWLLGSGKTPER